MFKELGTAKGSELLILRSRVKFPAKTFAVINRFAVFLIT